ncbi:hypothetical protein QNO07_10570 [Streptomyces sp. 549]|uniref:hypothetical protein n=1 Tax=Streptomyces sp. 549 TaxID=3049076 RepID=UPI0024C35F51|nr:hypothetical protein [Streptomyces sp. 549]MDK1473857.1 hypothetical protein [Streptomyces sp. 549]
MNNTTQEVRGNADEPVFVDESGRRRRTLRRLGWVLGLACACYAVVLVVSLAGGNAAAPWLPITGQADQGTEKVTVEGEPEADEEAEKVEEETVDATPVANPGEIPVSPGTSAGVPAAPAANNGVTIPQPTASQGVTTPQPSATPSASATKTQPPGSASGGGGGAEPPKTQEPPVDVPGPTEPPVGEETAAGGGE